MYIGLTVFTAGWIGKIKVYYILKFTKYHMNLLIYLHLTEVWCWILTAERQTAVIRTKYVQVILNQNMTFFDTYGNNGDIVNEILTDVQVIQSVIGEKV